jgi:hypothetical protein
MCGHTISDRSPLHYWLDISKKKRQHELKRNYDDIITGIKIKLSTPRCALFSPETVTYPATITATGRYINKRSGEEKNR